MVTSGPGVPQFSHPAIISLRPGSREIVVNPSLKGDLDRSRRLPCGR